jgi:ATP/maltotriose-dependent transcriptional regulator MalT
MAEADCLSSRERQVLELLARGYFYKEITETLGIAMSTVNTHVRRVYEKLHVHSRAQAVAKMTEPPARWLTDRGTKPGAGGAS